MSNIICPYYGWKLIYYHGQDESYNYNNSTIDHLLTTIPRSLLMKSCKLEPVSFMVFQSFNGGNINMMPCKVEEYTRALSLSKTLHCPQKSFGEDDFWGVIYLFVNQLVKSLKRFNNVIWSFTIHTAIRSLSCCI